MTGKKKRQRCYIYIHSSAPPDPINKSGTERDSQENTRPRLPWYVRSQGDGRRGVYVHVQYIHVPKADKRGKK